MEFLKGNEAGTGKYTPELNFAYELIVIIASEGQTDLVMDAARQQVPGEVRCSMARAPAPSR